MRKIVSVLTLFVLTLLSLTLVSALNETNLRLDSVRVNGDTIVNGQLLAVEEGQTLEIRIGLIANAGAEDIEVDAKIAGYEHSDSESLSDSTELFDLQAGTTKYVNLEVTLPQKLDKDTYTLRLRALDKNTPAIELNIPLAVEPVRHGVDIADVSFSPGNTVKAGRSLLTTVLIKNYGDYDEEDVRVTVSIPTLGVSATEFVNVHTDNHNVDYKDVPEMFLSIPATAAAGDYEVEVTAKFHDLAKTATKTYTIHVEADERFQESNTLVLAVGPEVQNVVSGKVATYAVALTNSGRTSKAFSIEPVNMDWATTTVSDGLVVLEPGRNAVVYVEVTPAATATFGEHIASVRVKSGSEVLETVTMRANVVEGAKAVNTAQNQISLRNGLEIALIVLVVVLVIIGLIIGFSRLHRDGEEETKTYY